MSSETSTEQSFQPWQLFTLAGLLGATVVVFMSRGQTPAGIILLSLTIFTAAALGVAAWRTLAPFTGGTVGGTTPVFRGRTRAALEREKALVLRAIKELEFDRAMGKLSEHDFSEMSGRLRARAGRLLRELDAGAGYRDEIEKEIEKRLGRGPQGSAPQVNGSAPPTIDAARAHPDAARTPVVRVCDACNTANDSDARFCKNCGTSMVIL
jgi:hypothetical protein